MEKENIKKEEKVIIENKFTKEQLISSKLFRNDKDVLSATLESNKEYTKKEVQEIIEKFKKGKVI